MKQQHFKIRFRVATDLVQLFFEKLQNPTDDFGAPIDNTIEEIFKWVADATETRTYGWLIAQEGIIQ